MPHGLLVAIIGGTRILQEFVLATLATFNTALPRLPILFNPNVLLHKEHVMALVLHGEDGFVQAAMRAFMLQQVLASQIPALLDPLKPVLEQIPMRTILDFVE
jgi:hypothetical protein